MTCEVCGHERGYGRGLCSAHIPDYYDYEISACFKRGFERLKAENASLLDKLGEARSDAAKLPMARKQRASAEQRAEAAEKALEPYRSGGYDMRADLASCSEELQRAYAARDDAEQRNTELEGALRLIEKEAGTGFRDFAWVRLHARAALHDEERSTPPQEVLAEIAAGWPAKHAGELYPEDVVVSAANAPQAPPEFCCDIRAVYGHGVHRTGCPGAQGEEK